MSEIAFLCHPTVGHLNTLLSMALPISTPPNAIAYASGEFTTRELARSGIIIGGAATLLIVLFGGAMMKFWGLL